MTHGDRDRVLASEEGVRPSPGFVNNVMAAVRREAAETPRLPFPWVRFGIGVTACSLMGAAGTVLLGDVSDAIVPATAIAPELSLAVAAVVAGLGLAAIPRVLFRS